MSYAEFKKAEKEKARREARDRAAHFGLSEADRTRVADILDEVIRDARPGKLPYRLCTIRSATARTVLSELTSRDWGLQAGEFFARFSDDDESTIGWDPALENEREIHVWCVPSGADIIVDMSTRHLPAYAATLGVTWTRKVLPYAWGSSKTLTDKGYDYKPHERARGVLEDGMMGLMESAPALAATVLDRYRG